MTTETTSRSYALSVGQDGLRKLGLPTTHAMDDLLVRRTETFIGPTFAPITDDDAVAADLTVRVFRPGIAGHGAVKQVHGGVTLTAQEARLLWGTLVVADACALNCLPLERLHQLLRDVNAYGSSILTGDGLDGINRDVTDTVDPAHLGGQIVLGDGTLLTYNRQTRAWEL